MASHYNKKATFFVLACLIAIITSAPNTSENRKWNVNFNEGNDPLFYFVNGRVTPTFPLQKIGEKNLSTNSLPIDLLMETL